MSTAPDLNPFAVIDGKSPPPAVMTEEEFDAWCDEDIKAEWVDGRVIVMAAASVVHVKLTDFLIRVMGSFVEGRRLGQVLGPELQVRLPPDGRRRVPDLLFLAKHRELGPLYFEGAPNLIVEVVSPDSIDRDWRDKYHDYLAAGVREYWIVDPLERRVATYSLSGPRGYLPIAEIKGRIASSVLRGFYLKPQWLCREELPKVQVVLREIMRGR